MNGTCTSGVIFVLPIIRAKITIVIPMLNIWPVSLIVLKVAEATPKNRFSTELITAFVLGEEKRPNPRPRTIRLMIIIEFEKEASIKIKGMRPIVLRAIPVVATSLGSTLSDNLPDRGAQIAITRGCAIKIIPACLGV